MHSGLVYLMNTVEKLEPIWAQKNKPAVAVGSMGVGLPTPSVDAALGANLETLELSTETDWWINK